MIVKLLQLNKYLHYLSLRRQKEVNNKNEIKISWFK